MKAKRITIQDIADRSGYSKTAVSFAFNSPSRISKEAVEKILRTAKELDYIPDPMARNFSIGRHMALGFLMPQRIEHSLMNPYMQAVIRSVAGVCQEHGYMLTLIPPLHSSVTEAVKNATVDGLITMGLTIDRSIHGILQRRHLPFVSIDGSGESSISTVSIDEELAAETQMRKVLEKGHRKIAVITLPDDAYAGSERSLDTIISRRKAGYSRALADYSMTLDDLMIASCEATIGDGMRTAEKMLDSFTPTCFVTMSDAAALGVLRLLAKRHKEEISAVGFDGIEDDGFPSYGLATIVQSARKKGAESASLLFSMIEGESGVQHITVPFSFREGRTLKENKWK